MDKMSIQQLADNYGTLDLLNAYIMRTANVNEETAIDILYQIDFELERWIDELILGEDEEC